MAEDVGVQMPLVGKLFPTLLTSKLFHIGVGESVSVSMVLPEKPFTTFLTFKVPNTMFKLPNTRGSYNRSVTPATVRE